MNTICVGAQIQESQQLGQRQNWSYERAKKAKITKKGQIKLTTKKWQAKKFSWITNVYAVR